MVPGMDLCNEHLKQRAFSSVLAPLYHADWERCTRARVHHQGDLDQRGIENQIQGGAGRGRA